MNQIITAPTMPADLNEREAHELTFEQFAAQARATKLENFGRQWSVALPGRYVSFSDAATAEGALKDAHEGAVNNALFLSANQDSFDFVPTLPPAEVLEQYPDVVARFPELGIDLKQHA